MDDGRDEGRECRKVRRGVLEAIDRSRSLGMRTSVRVGAIAASRMGC